MNPEDFIKTLSEQAGIDTQQAGTVNGILESTFLAGNKNKNFIVQQISEKLGVDEGKAEMIYTVAIGLISTGVLSKIKNMIFRR